MSGTTVRLRQRHPLSPRPRRNLLTMDKSSPSNDDGGGQHSSQQQQQQNDYNNDDDMTYMTIASNGSNSRRNKQKKGPSHEMKHIDEEHGYEMSSLLRSEATSHNKQHLQSKKHKHHKSNKNATAIDHGGRDSDDDNTALLGDDADDTKNNSESDIRSRTLFLKTAFWISCWYGTSLATLFLNKIILSRPGSSVHVLGMCQMTTAAVLGGWSTFGGADFVYNTAMSVWRYLPFSGGSGVSSSSSRGNMKGGEHHEDNKRHLLDPTSPTHHDPSKTNFHFIRDMSIVGVLRGLTVVLGLIALEHVPVSFVETIKATAPVFTVLFAKLILAERTATPVMLTLIPVVAGLILCSASELRFDAVGFVAAVMNNCADCVQNVMSKRMLAHLKPTQLQFYTSVAALALQTPFVLRDATGLVHKWAAHRGVNEDILVDVTAESEDSSLDDELSLTKLLIIDAIFYHLQSVSAYCTMGCMSPVSQSVANTLKRALLVWASILYFGNPVTNSGIGGIIMVVSGVFLYNHVRRIYQS